jgi:hypothetical protein
MFVRLYRRWLGAIHNVKEVAMAIREWLVTLDPSYCRNGICKLVRRRQNFNNVPGGLIKHYTAVDLLT